MPVIKNKKVANPKSIIICMERMADTANTIIDDVITEWNDIKLPLVEQLIDRKFKDHFRGCQTQEKTKLVAPILDRIFARRMREKLPKFIIANSNGHDYMYGNIPIESKITFSEGNSWTGNGYAKTPWHLLMRFRMLENGQIDAKFATLCNLEDCTTKWTTPKKSSNFSALVFLNDDLKHMIPITGNFKCCQKKLKPLLVEYK